MTSSNSSKKWEPDATILKFSCKLCPENVSDNNNAISYDLCQNGSTFNVAILIILITNIYKVVTNHGIVFPVPQCSFHLVIW